MINVLKEFFGFGGYSREVEGYFSPQHLIFVSAFVLLMILLAVIFGLKNRRARMRKKNRPLVVAAILILLFKAIEVSVITVRSDDPGRQWLYLLPLFMCSIQMITIPLAAFSHGRLKEASLDFVLIFGLLGALLGTYAAGNNYSSYPVVCFDNTISALTHTVSGFASLYIAISGMASMKRKNIPITYGIILFFCAAAYVADVLIPYNYMFLIRADGTPYELVYSLTGGNAVLYPVAGYCSLSILPRFTVYSTCSRKRNVKLKVRIRLNARFRVKTNLVEQQ